MAPPTTVVALLIILALVPGWFYLRLIEPLDAPRSSSGLHQLLEVLAVGAATTGVSVLVMVLVPHSWIPFSLDIQAWAGGGKKYLKGHIHQAAVSSALLLASSLAIAYGLARVRFRRQPGEFHHSNTWVQSLGARPYGTLPYVGLHLSDGRLLEGKLHAFDLDSDDGNRDIALARPIRITPPDGTGQVDLLNLDRVVVGSDHIDFITVHHLRIPPPRPVAAPRRFRLGRRRQGSR